MQILISAVRKNEISESELRSLYDWLVNEEQQTGALRFRSPDSRAGEMGSATDAIQVAVGAGGAVSVLAASVAMWIRTRHPQVRLRLRRENGVELEIDGQVKDADALIERFIDAAKSEG